jgi:DNA (cytosine-5)-methyltransferase 1
MTPPLDMLLAPRKAVATRRKLIIDMFAGAGGVSDGIKRALGVEPDYAINHSPGALAMHRANHPGTIHLCEDVFAVDPASVVGPDDEVGLLWASPDCTHFSAARGSKPVSHRVRGLAWVVIRWVKKLKENQRPDVIILENVREFQTWGPLIKKRDKCGRIVYDKQGRALEVPDPKRKGITFKRWKTMLKNFGYEIEHQVLDAADYGAPTHRKRFFLIARRDGKPIVWPEKTHANLGSTAARPDMFRTQGTPLKPYRTAAECIDWSIKCPSIFLNRREARKLAKILGLGGLKRPLAKATMSRSAKGLLRYIMRYREQGKTSPYLVGLGGRVDSCQEPRALDIEKPLGTVVAGGVKHAVVAPVITPIQNYGHDSAGNDADKPLNTVTAHPKGGGFALTAAHLVQVNHSDPSTDSGQAAGRQQSLEQPLHTITGKHGTGIVEVQAQRADFIIKHYGGVVGTEIDNPLPTCTARATQNQIMTADLMKLRGTCKDGQEIDDPAPTIAAGGQHEAIVAPVAIKFYGTGQAIELDEPLDTITGKARFAITEAVIGRASWRGARDSKTATSSRTRPRATRWQELATACPHPSPQRSLAQTTRGPHEKASGMAAVPKWDWASNRPAYVTVALRLEVRRTALQVPTHRKWPISRRARARRPDHVHG